MTTVSNPGDADFARRLRKGAWTDPTASGATRIAGSQDFKEKYAPDFPYIKIAHIAPRPDCHPGAARPAGTGRAGRETPRQVVSSFSHTPRSRKWPSYQRCVEGAPPQPRQHRPRHQPRRLTWCLTALDWGWNILGLEHRGRGRPPHGTQQQGPRERRAIRASDRPERCRCHPAKAEPDGQVTLDSAAMFFRLGRGSR